MKRILVTGATGQIGSELVPFLRSRYGADRVIAIGHSKKPSHELQDSGPYMSLDIRNHAALDDIISHLEIGTVYHLAALLSAVAENQPLFAWDININGLLNVLESAKKHKCKLFHPSSIGAFGATTPHVDTPQETIQRPNSMYGVAKVSAELLCDYYFTRYHLDTRGVRFPGLISHKTMPGGGTTDYAVDIFYAALRKKKYTCFLRPDTRLDMMYMPDALRATVEIMEADPARLCYRNAYNISAMSFTPQELAAEISKHITGFQITYEIDPVRQAIADSWPDNMDDTPAREQWDWKSEYNLEQMTMDMLNNLANQAPKR
ncbi:MAG: NAD-dependent epimerase/dehydratase family protein [Desulfobulbaceae bacterium]|nr:NAD-dependent epimerase/dehydratase family protein [Desulfobulbaceae bacterium]